MNDVILFLKTAVSDYEQFNSYELKSILYDTYMCGKIILYKRNNIPTSVIQLIVILLEFYFDPIAIKDLHINHSRINYYIHREIIAYRKDDLYK